MTKFFMGKMNPVARRVLILGDIIAISSIILHSYAMVILAMVILVTGMLCSNDPDDRSAWFHVALLSMIWTSIAVLLGAAYCGKMEYISFNTVMWLMISDAIFVVATSGLLHRWEFGPNHQSQRQRNS